MYYQNILYTPEETMTESFVSPWIHVSRTHSNRHLKCLMLSCAAYAVRKLRFPWHYSCKWLQDELVRYNRQTNWQVWSFPDSPTNMSKTKLLQLIWASVPAIEGDCADSWHTLSLLPSSLLSHVHTSLQMIDKSCSQWASKSSSIKSDKYMIKSVFKALNLILYTFCLFV